MEYKVNNLFYAAGKDLHNTWDDWGRFWDAQNRPQSSHHR